MTTLHEAAQQALEALKLARRSHGTMLMSDPPQEAWKANRVDSALLNAIEALREALALTSDYVPCYSKSIVEMAQQPELSTASKSEQLLASHDHALRAEFGRMKAALAQQGYCQCADQRDCTGACCVSKQQGEEQPVVLCERICTAIKAADDKCMDEAGYMLDSNDCIRIVREHFAEAAPAAQPLTCKHEWFRTGAMKPDECRCIHCGTWNKVVAAPTAQPYKGMAGMFPGLTIDPVTGNVGIGADK